MTVDLGRGIVERIRAREENIMFNELLESSTEKSKPTQVGR
jgi:hypothetical protein